MSDENKSGEVISEENAPAGEDVGSAGADLEKCMRERDEYLDGWKRAKADFINYKKEESERIAGIVKFSNEALVSELIMILDSLDLAISVLKDDKAAYKGISLIKFQLEDVLKKYGLEKIRIAPGAKFDPGRQEAISEIFSEYDAGLIAEEIESGYVLHGRVLRPSKVNISKGREG